MNTAMELAERRWALILSLERIATMARYLCFVILGPFFLLGYPPDAMRDFLSVTVVLGLHNVYYHILRFTGREAWFQTFFNVVIYIAEASLVVAFTGGARSDMFAMYMLVLIGFGAYTQRFRSILGLAATCCFCFGVTILVTWGMQGETESGGIIALKILAIMGCGWLVGRGTELLGRAEEAYLAQAQALASSEAALRAILDNAADAVLVFDENEFITEANDRATEYLRTSRDKLVGERIRSFLFDDGTLPNKMAALRSHGHYRGEQLMIDPEGEEHPAQILVRSFVRDRRRFFVLVAQDTAERKHLEEATRLAHIDLERLNNELQEINRLKTGFLITVSQKLRSPLSAIIGYVEMLLNDELGDLNPEQQRALRTCRRAGLRIVRVMDQEFDLVPQAHPEGQAPPQYSQNGPASGVHD